MVRSKIKYEEETVRTSQGEVPVQIAGELVYFVEGSSNVFLRYGVPKHDRVPTDDFHLSDFLNDDGAAIFSERLGRFLNDLVVWESAELLFFIAPNVMAQHGWRFISSWKDGSFWRNSERRLWATINTPEKRIRLRRDGDVSYYVSIVVQVDDKAYLNKS